MTNQLHVILGAGQIGSRLAKVLREQGHRVRIVQRSASKDSEVISGDLTDLAFAEEATRGATVVYDCMNPPYHQWPTLLLPIARGALHGARKANARLVALDCLYMYGRPDGPMTETTPRNPCSKKGELRVKLEQLRLGADVPVSIGRASDFFGPALQFSAWNERFFTRLANGTPGECMGDPDLPHSYTFADDIAVALATLGAHDDATGIWHLPTAPAVSSREITTRLGRELGIDARLSGMPRWLLNAIGVVSPFMREVAEMAYQWDVPFIIDDSRFVKRFGITATSLDQQVKVTAAWAKTHFAQFGTGRPMLCPSDVR
ncbi:MAG: NAD-dependent epimerase/dehydratase family protein [Archangium sp.]